MTAPSTHGLSREARNLHWLLANLVEEVPGLLSIAVVSSDGLLLLSSDAEGGTHTGRDDGGAGGAAQGRSARAAATGGPRGSAADLATIVSGLGSLTLGAAKLMDGGKVKQTVVTMREGNLCVMAISDGSLLGVHATPECDMSIVAYHMAFFVSRAGHVLTPELRSELRQSMENGASNAARDERVPGAVRRSVAEPARSMAREPLAGRPAGRT
ncbi:roadblock/LC7 domain-containing protein [Streptomyces odontomachi]|uniref:roadblock/LC7 domain-containing protein n=1 Tax=Streptomyces odontomachi TaxID=2944940 RepID=UPI0035A8E12A